MSFFKKIAKEINVVKSMIDIPELKKERHILNKNLQDAYLAQQTEQDIIDRAHIIRQTTQLLQSLENVCYKDRPSELERAQTVINYLNDSVKNAEEFIIRNKENISVLEQNIKKINDKLSKARAMVS